MPSGRSRDGMTPIPHPQLHFSTSPLSGLSCSYFQPVPLALQLAFWPMVPPLAPVLPQATSPLSPVPRSQSPRPGTNSTDNDTGRQFPSTFPHVQVAITSPNDTLFSQPMSPSAAWLSRHLQHDSWYSRHPLSSQVGLLNSMVDSHLPPVPARKHVNDAAVHLASS